MKKRAKAITGVVVAACLVAAGFYVWKYTDLLNGILGGEATAEDKVYVESVASITSMNSGSQNEYMGVVESQETSEVNADSSKTVNSILVSVGDQVTEGQKLFTYDTTESQNQIETYQLDLEKYDAQIEAYQNQIKEIETQRDKAIEKKTAKDSDLLDYATQIQSVQLSIQEVENSKKSTNLSIEKCRQEISNSYVTAKISGTVKEINDPETMVSDAYADSSKALIVIEAEGDYRVKGTVNEQNIYAVSEGQAVIVKSRVNEDTWTGTITKIDTENPSGSDSSTSDYMYSTSSATSSTDYPFYITLDSTDGLLLGQHLYIEMDYGQTEEKEGIWLNSGYLVFDGDKTYVWARNDKEKLEKRTVEVGEYDENMDQYEILSGLSMTDYICAAMDYLYEGVTCVTDMNDVDYSSPMYSSESDAASGDEYYDETYSDEEIYTDDEIDTSTMEAQE